MRIFFLITFLVCAAVFGSAQTPPPDRTNYRLGAGDQIIIRAANDPDISEKPIRVDLSGYINMPTIGHIHAAGMTADQLEAAIADRLKVIIEEPDVAVSVMEFQSQPVSVYGEVMTPGVHQLQGRKTLVELLAVTGGVKEDAGPALRITRQLEYGRIPLPGAKDDPTGKYSIAELQIKPLIDAKTPDFDIAIQPYDVISVPKADFVFIAGDVTKAGALPLSDGPRMSLLVLLATSGGPTRTSDLKKARIMRLVAGQNKRDQIPVDIAKIVSGKADDVELSSGDILLIPGSGLKRAQSRALESAIQAGTLLMTYGIIGL
jgi:polysaccharide export outer membrane protein